MVNAPENIPKPDPVQVPALIKPIESEPPKIDYGRLEPAVVNFSDPIRVEHKPETFDWATRINEENYNEAVFKPITIPKLKVAI